MKTVLVDSSFWISEGRQGRDPLKSLALASHNHEIATCGVIRCEVARGIRSRNVLEKFQRFWDVMICIPTDNRLWTDVEQLLWTLDREGKVIPLTDAVIACCALRVNAIVLTLDHHFQVVPELTTIQSVSEI